MPDRAETPAVEPGRLIVVVGPSGVGKDSLLAAARGRLSGRDGLMLVRRTITRPETGDAEAHLPMSLAGFEAAEKQGAFAFTWRAHGLAYGLPAALDAHLDAGRPALVNGSRKMLAAMAERFPGLAVVSVTASPEAVAARLAARGRETPEEIAARIARAAEIPAVAPVVTVDNSGPLTHTVEDFITAIEELLV